MCRRVKCRVKCEWDTAVSCASRVECAGVGGCRPLTPSAEEIVMNLSMLRAAASMPAVEERGGTEGAVGARPVDEEEEDDDPALRLALARSLRVEGAGGGGGVGETEETLEQQMLARTATMSMDSAPAPEARPVPREVREAFPWLVVDEAFDWSGYLGAAEECPICQDAVALGDVLRAMPCCHCYHEHCIQPWMDRNDWCPVCRASLVNNCTPTEDDGIISAASPGEAPPGRPDTIKDMSTSGEHAQL